GIGQLHDAQILRPADQRCDSRTFLVKRKIRTVRENARASGAGNHGILGDGGLYVDGEPECDCSAGDSRRWLLGVSRLRQRLERARRRIVVAQGFICGVRLAEQLAETEGCESEY